MLEYQVGVKFTAGEILDHIYRFYAGEIHDEMEDDELEQISKTEDGWGYADQAKQALQDGTVLYRHQVMGDCMHFEGLHYVRTTSQGAPVYRICLGS